LSFFIFHILHSNGRSWFLFKFLLLDHITTSYGHLKTQDNLHPHDPLIPLFIGRTFLSLWTLFESNFIPKDSSFGPLSNGIYEYKNISCFRLFLCIGWATQMHKTGIRMAKLPLHRAVKSPVDFRLGRIP
jgi:hypothetical protein